MNVATLLKRWSSETETPPLTTLYGFSRMSAPELEVFRESWPAIPVERRRRMVRGMVEITEASFEVDYREVFRYLLTDTDAEVRAEAVEGLWEDESPACLRSLFNLLRQDPSPLVRSKAASSLGRFALLAELEQLDGEIGAEVRQALRQVIDDEGEEIEVCRRAVESIAYFGDEEVWRIIQAAYHHESKAMRVSAVFAMGRSIDPSWAPTLLAELKSRDPEMRYEAARSCGELELQEVIPQLTQLVHDPDREVQGAALAALGQIGGPEARRLLVSFADSEDKALAEAAQEALDDLEFATGSVEMPLTEDGSEDGGDDDDDEDDWP